MACWKSFGLTASWKWCAPESLPCVAGASRPTWPRPQAILPKSWRMMRSRTRFSFFFCQIHLVVGRVRFPQNAPYIIAREEKFFVRRNRIGCKPRAFAADDSFLSNHLLVSLWIDRQPGPLQARANLSADLR